MIGFVFASLLALPTPYGALAATPETYEVPVIRPFEPPSDFGREQAQGDDGGEVHRRALTAPVTVDAYVRSYETSPTDSEVAYDQGVTQAEIDTDARMGPLDGRWRVADSEGRPLLSLALTDRGGGRMIEGAWRDPAGGAVARTGIAGPARRVGDIVIVPLQGAELRLERAGQGWAGTLVRDGRSRPVALSRPA